MPVVSAGIQCMTSGHVWRWGPYGSRLLCRAYVVLHHGQDGFYLLDENRLELIMEATEGVLLGSPVPHP